MVMDAYHNKEITPPEDGNPPLIIHTYNICALMVARINNINEATSKLKMPPTPAKRYED
jgi:hypothetical protein